MKHREFRETVRRELGGTATQMAADLAIAAVTRAIADGLQEDGEVKLAGFGSFRIQRRKARRLTLPHSGASMQLPERSVLRFTPAPLKEKVDRKQKYTQG